MLEGRGFLSCFRSSPFLFVSPHRYPPPYIVPTATPRTNEKVNWLKEAMGIQSSRIPQFPEYDARGRQLKVHKCTFERGQEMDLHV